MTSIKVKIVCVECNNGWMSGIVEKAKPVVKSLLLGNRITITPIQQRHLAAWISLCCITAEFLPGSNQVVPARHRRYLLRHHRPPEEWSIYIGHFSGAKYDRYYTHSSYHLKHSNIPLPDSLIPMEFEDAGPLNTIESIFIIAKLISYVFMTTSSPRNSIMFEQWANPRILVRIWPPRRFWPFPARLAVWPPEATIDDGAIESLATAFYNHVNEPKTF